MEALIYLPDLEALRGIHADWPDDMCAILCLHQSGRCELQLHHIEEDADAALAKAVGATDRGAGRVYVVPATEGYPTRKLSFSEEQALCGLLDGLTDLPDLAADYAQEYRYSKDVAFSREMAELVTSVSKGPRHQGSPGGAPRNAEGRLVGRVSMTDDCFRLVVGGRDHPSGAGREFLGRVVDVPLRGCSVRLAWDGEVSDGDVVLIPYGSVPPAAYALWRRGGAKVQLKLVSDGAVVDPEHGQVDRSWRFARVASMAFLITSAGVLTAGVAVAFG